MLMRRWVTDNLGSAAWLLLAPAAAWVPHLGLKMHFDFHLRPLVRRMLPFLDPYVTIDISSKLDYSSDRIKSSDGYEEVKAYLSSKRAREARALIGDGEAEGDGFVLSLREGQAVSDEFKGVTVSWASVRPSQQDRNHCLRLTFDQRHWDLADEYLRHVRRCGRVAMIENRRRRLYTNKKSIIDYSNKVWSYIDFEHPTTFDTLAMHPEKKRRIMDDLDDFRNGKKYYRRIGKAWKRGYLLYGPPGTGKSSMIAAMANYLEYDIYDIELTMVPSNSDLRKLLTETKGKSIIVIEDIDCCLDDVTGPRSRADARFDLPDAGGGAKRKRTSEMTLSGLLNFIDGLWSAAHSGARIIVFTTNFVDKLDPALIRRGRMDMHVEMSYCCFEAFQTLAKNYLGVDAHPLFGTVKELLQAVEITPADVAECFMASKRADVSLAHLVDELKQRAQVKEDKEDMKRTEGEEAAASADAKPDDAQEDMANAKPDGAEGMAKRRRVFDKGDDKVAVKPANEAMAANGETASGVRANGGSIDLNHRSSSDHDGKEKVDADAEADAAETNGTVADGDLSDSGDDDMDDCEDHMDDYDCDYDDDDMADYDDDDDDEEDGDGSDDDDDDD